MKTQKKEINTIIFDLSEVYLKGYHRVEEKLEFLLKIDPKKIKVDYLKKVEKEFDILMKGKITEEEFWNQLINKTNINLSIPELKKAVRENFEEIKGTREIIERLKKSGFKLGLLSNHSKEWIDHCNNRFDYHKLFDSILYSFEIGICKPNREIYLKILQKLKKEPQNCLFIDDSIENVISAKKLGINTILFKTPEQLLKDLKKLGVEI